MEGRTANFCISLDIFEFLRFGRFFPFFKKIGFLDILGPWVLGFWWRGHPPMASVLLSASVEI